MIPSFLVRTVFSGYRSGGLVRDVEVGLLSAAPGERIVVKARALSAHFLARPPYDPHPTERPQGLPRERTRDVLRMQPDVLPIRAERTQTSPLARSMTDLLSLKHRHLVGLGRRGPGVGGFDRIEGQLGQGSTQPQWTSTGFGSMFVACGAEWAFLGGRVRRALLRFRPLLANPRDRATPWCIPGPPVAGIFRHSGKHRAGRPAGLGVLPLRHGPRRGETLAGSVEEACPDEAGAQVVGIAALGCTGSTLPAACRRSVATPMDATVETCIDLGV